MKNNKIQLFLLVLLAVSLLSGCDAGSPSNCRATVIEKYGGDVQTIPNGNKYNFLARETNGAVYYVECLDVNDAKITSEVLIFPPNK